MIVNIWYLVYFELYFIRGSWFAIKETFQYNVAFTIFLPALKQMSIFAVKVFQFIPVFTSSFRWRGFVNKVYRLVQCFESLFLYRFDVWSWGILVDFLWGYLHVHSLFTFWLYKSNYLHTAILDFYFILFCGFCEYLSWPYKNK